MAEGQIYRHDLKINGLIRCVEMWMISWPYHCLCDVEEIGWLVVNVVLTTEP